MLFKIKILRMNNDVIGGCYLLFVYCMLGIVYFIFIIIYRYFILIFDNNFIKEGLLLCLFCR